MKLIKITAMWCMSCILMNDRIDDVLKDINDLELVELDYDDDEDIVDKYDVGKTLPVLILMDDDKEIRRSIGEKSEKELKEFLEVGD